MASETTTLDVTRPDQVHLDSAFEHAASEQNIGLPWMTRLQLDVASLELFSNLDLAPPEANVSEQFLAAVMDTREPAPATFDATPEHVQHLDVASLG